MGSTEQHYSLRWNDYTVKIVTAFQSLRDEEDFVDVTVACDGHHYSAHKMVLSACSPYFRSILRMNPCQHPIVILKDVGHVELERLLEFMYNGEVNIAQDQLAAFLKTAENLKIRGLAGSSEDMDQLQNKDAFHEFTNTNSGANNTGLTSGKSSPSVGFNNNIASIKDSPGYGPNIVSKDEEGNGTGNTLDSGISYSRIESPQSKRRKRNNAPATSHTDSNTSSHTPDGMVSESGVDLDGTGVTGNSLSMEEDLRMIERREMKPEPSDSLVTELGSDVSHQGDQLDQRPVMYPLGMAGPSSTPGVGSQENLSSQEPGALGGAVCEALNLSLRPTAKTDQSNGPIQMTPVTMNAIGEHHHPLQHRLLEPVSSVATAVISHSSDVAESEEVDIKPRQFIEFVYPEFRFGVPCSEKMASLEMADTGPVSSANRMGVNVPTSEHGFKAKTYPCQECHKVFRHPMSLHHHRHVHKGTYTCDSCGKVFSRRWDLHRHIHRSKMGCRRPHSVTMPVVSHHCQEFTLDLNNPPSN